jgi:cephalosporin hydroxylase
VTVHDPRSLDFCPELAHLMTRSSVQGRSGKTFGKGAMSTLNNLLTLRQLMMELRPERTLEVGLSVGGSALIFASGHRDLGRAAAQQHIAIDPFQDSFWDSTGLDGLQRAGLAGFVDVRQAPSAIALPALFGTNLRVGLAYVDGSHLVEDVLVDAYFVTRLLVDGGVVAFDDCTDPHVGKVIAFLRANGGNGLAELDLRRFRPDHGRPMRYRLARMLGRTQLTAFRRVGAVERPWNAPFRNF